MPGDRGGPACPVCGEEVLLAEATIAETGYDANGWRTLKPGTATYHPCGHQTRFDLTHGRPGKMALLSRETILGADDTRYDEVSCPEWGGNVRLRSISGTQRDAYESSIVQTNGSDRKVNLRNARTKLIVLCAVDEEGRLLFSAEDVNALGRKSAAPLDRLFDACQKLAGMSKEDVDKLTENFDDDPSDEGTSV